MSNFERDGLLIKKDQELLKYKADGIFHTVDVLIAVVRLVNDIVICSIIIVFKIYIQIIKHFHNYKEKKLKKKSLMKSKSYL